MDIEFNLNDYAAKCGVCDTKVFSDRTEKLFRILKEYNSTTNVTRITSEKEYWSKHVADSLSIGLFFKDILKQPLQLADIGCGAGFPSLILACAFPSLQVTAVDSIGKKTRFVELAAQSLGLDNTAIITARSKELLSKEEWQNKFDIVTGRAVADARKLFRETRTLVKSDGKFIYYKTPSQITDDMPQVSSFSKKFGFKWKTTPVFELPGNGGKRQFLYT